ncbi:hypothetical protein K0M31_010711 [Melipona bicolor]|uniref:Uncharacterized protein n=1 Tax=Melipona bicolor TaxID=60889 RepID=A0AA40FLD0_9HYME|nr:hypothetical protein K0M31_010711 [Melipona bicolor]
MHVVIRGKMNSRRESLPDIDDARANDSNIIKLTMISSESRDNDAGGFLTNYGKQQQQQDEYSTSDKILGSSHSIEIPQTHTC